MELNDFKVGDRVKFTEEALRTFPHSRSTKGEVRRIGRKMLYVHRDGLKSIETWRPKWWELEEPATVTSAEQ